jgi:PAS domain S-box-containing protein
MTSTIPETSRLAALTKLDLLDTRAEPRFDRFTRLAALTFGVPIALISLVDEKRQWFKSRCGLDIEQTDRSIAFCSHTVAQRGMLVVEDTATDPRFADNPLVKGAPHVRFYAGQPVYCDGQAVGTLCIADRNPRRFDDQQRRALRDLAELVEVELNQARAATARLMAEQVLKSLNAELEKRVAQRTAELEARFADLSAEIAQRKVAEMLLRDAQSWNRTIVATSYSAFVGADAEGRIIEWNPAAERIFGWSRLEAVGRALAELIVPAELRAAHTAGIRRFLATGTSRIVDRQVELPALTPSGRRIAVEMRVGACEWQGRRCIGAFIDDVSERNRTRQQLEEKQELLDAVLESIDVAVVACDAAGSLSLFNKKARMLHGLDRDCVKSPDWSSHYSLYEADGHTPLPTDEVPLVRVLRGEVVREQAIAVAPASRPAATLLASGRPLRSTNGRARAAGRERTAPARRHGRHDDRGRHGVRRRLRPAHADGNGRPRAVCGQERRPSHVRDPAHGRIRLRHRQYSRRSREGGNPRRADAVQAKLGSPPSRGRRSKGISRNRAERPYISSRSSRRSISCSPSWATAALK